MFQSAVCVPATWQNVIRVREKFDLFQFNLTNDPKFQIDSGHRASEHEQRIIPTNMHASLFNVARWQRLGAALNCKLV